MAWLQKLILRLMPKGMAAAAEADSRRWRIRCLTCNCSISVWEAGGIRYKAASKGKRTMIRCPQCKKLRAAAVEKTEDVPGTAPPAAS